MCDREEVTHSHSHTQTMNGILCRKEKIHTDVFSLSIGDLDHDPIYIYIYI